MVGGCTAAALWDAISRTCSILLAVFLCNCHQARGTSRWGWIPGLSVWKISYRAQTKKLLKCKQTIQIVTFNVRTLNKIGQLPELKFYYNIINLWAKLLLNRELCKKDGRNVFKICQSSNLLPCYSYKIFQGFLRDIALPKLQCPLYAIERFARFSGSLYYLLFVLLKLFDLVWFCFFV